MADVLIVEDETNVREGLAAALRSAGHAVRMACDGEEGLALWRAKRPDLTLLDVMMPVRDGWSVCMEIRRLDAVAPVVFLTAKKEESDKVLGLGLGADDYLVKPVGVGELLARVAARLKRVAAASRRTARVGEWIVDFDRREMQRADGAFEILSPGEADLLHAFCARPGETLSYDDQMRALGRSEFVMGRGLDQQIARLRKKLGASAACLETVRGYGRRLAGGTP